MSIWEAINKNYLLLTPTENAASRIHHFMLSHARCLYVCNATLESSINRKQGRLNKKVILRLINGTNCFKQQTVK